MRLIRPVAAIACLMLGAVVGVLNPQPVSLDLGFVVLRTSLGLSVLLALLLGVVAGGAVLAVSLVAPLRKRLRAVERARGRLES
ncbi:MAG TPA: lipopolysaccharide assembly protein LapA domain-containing protein [Thermomonas sp.]|nr:lipopolysaccharide assembly protein LapA domain-containing protein [Thermomonas sp.]